nr:hypothetical protein [Tanacetum cinerariifolium]
MDIISLLVVSDDEGVLDRFEPVFLPEYNASIGTGGSGSVADSVELDTPSTPAVPNKKKKKVKSKKIIGDASSASRSETGDSSGLEDQAAQGVVLDPSSPKYLSGLARASLAGDDLNDLIIKYKIPRDLHPQLPLEEFVMFELLDDAVGVYHRMFDFSGVRIPFSTFEVLCRSLQIELTVTLFMVFQTLYSAINDLKPHDGAFNMEDVLQLSAHVIKLRDMPKGVLVLSGLSCNTPKLARSRILGSRRATSWINNTRYILNDQKVV